MLSFRPTYLAIDAAGNVFATDYYNNRVLKFDASGALMTAWGISGSNPGEFSYPSGIAVDASGNVLVADTFNNRIQQFDSDGTFVAEWGSEGSDYGAFNWPMGIGAGASGAIYVADTFNNRIQVFDVSASPCIITALLGEADYRTERMRHFRDAVLAHSMPGRRIIDLYGRTSALLQPVIDRSPLCKCVARIILKSAAAALTIIAP